jgi:hypothetical protein
MGRVVVEVVGLVVVRGGRFSVVVSSKEGVAVGADARGRWVVVVSDGG